MSKVRIYELAKEAGLKSKELADKLIELGYPIKSHSSTVSDEVAKDIRRKVLGSAVAEVTATRIEVKKPTVSTSVKTTVVRRRSKAEKEEIARKAEEEETVLLEADVEAVQPSGDVEDNTLSEETSDVVVDEMPKVEQVEEAVEEISLKTDQTDDDGSGEASGEMVKQADVTKKKIEAPEGAVQRPKGLAKVVGMVNIQQVTDDRPKPPKRNARPKPGVKTQRNIPNVVTPPHDDGQKTAGKGKKKGKRIVSIDSDKGEDRNKKPGKVGKKSRRKGDYGRGSDGEYSRFRKGQRRKDNKREKSAQVVAETKAIKKRIKVFETISVGDLAKRMGIKANEIIGKLMGLGVMATLNQALDIDTASLVASDFGFEVEQGMTDELGVIQLQENEEGGEQVSRPPVITVMGHVDHGKTSILDAIRKTDVAAGEAGGITQHIGAYQVQSPSGDLVFVDTPGHAAFTEMRSRGAKVTDIVVLVVAADDGVMDQTKEAIAHAKAAEVPIVVAVNKIDKDNADPDRVKRELSDFDLVPEDWGGDIIYCHTAAKFNKGIDELLEAIQLQAEILELKADPSRKARGTVIEAQLHKGRGAVATVLIQDGTLQTGDFFVAGAYSGKVRSLNDDKGGTIQEAGPSIPVEVQGLSGVPQAGDEFIVVTDEKMAKSVSESRQLKVRELELASASVVSLDNLFEKMAEQQVKELRVILRSDVQGTLEAFT
ncbi:MAG: translation initiation factor IF-2, partial [Desulfobulbaceae bacterium]|nr:translation initiation factor IF-2 [Desulfobulbaceae bacterium]